MTTLGTVIVTLVIGLVVLIDMSVIIGMYFDKKVTLQRQIDMETTKQLKEIFAIFKPLVDTLNKAMANDLKAEEPKTDL